jgi:serine/threonine protein kinase
VTPEQWDKINELFQAASRLPPDQRDAYLVEVCPDQPIRHEVRSLLAHASGDDFLNIDPERLVGKTLCHYRITGYIGHGSMGHVYKAQDTKLDRLIALKLLPPDLKNDSKGIARLEREAKSASALNHPNIVIVHAIDRDETVNADFIVMEFVSGRTLSGILRSGEGVPSQQACGYAIQIADGLAAAHRKNILHGDLKPSNIMINDEDLVKLLDFGLARARYRELGDPTKSELVGTTAYMAPERIGLPLFDPRSEVFSFGIILYQMLSGKHPFGILDAEAMAKAIHREIPKPLSTQVPIWLTEIVDHCLEKNPAQRFQTMQEVLAALKRDERYGGSSSTTRRNTPDVDEVRESISRISYRNVAQSCHALDELTSLVGRDLSVDAWDAAVTGLRDVILTLDNDRSGVSGSVRKVRTKVMDVLKRFTFGHLGVLFVGGGLEELDLFRMDLSATQFEGTSFRQCFLAETSFRESRLANSSLAGAWIRNVDFTAADLSGVDFTDTDWFNTIGLTESQLAVAQRETLMVCPADIAAMHRYLDDRYGFPFNSWAGIVQEQITSSWDEYLRPGGLRDVVAQWRGRSS